MIVSAINIDSPRSGDASRRLLHDGHETLRVEARPADERAVDLTLRQQRLHVVGLHAAAVQNPRTLGDFLGRELRQEPAHVPVDLGRLLRRGVHSGPDGPHRLVRDDDAGDGGRVQPGQACAQLTFDRRKRQALASLLRRLADAEHRSETERERAVHLLVDQLVGLAHLSPPLGVPGEHAATSELDEHRRGDLTRVRARPFMVAVLAAEADGGAVNDLAHRGERGERRTQHDVDALEPLEAVANARGEWPCFRERADHLPVADDERRAHQAASVRAATPGSVRPSRNSRKAPPAVEMYPILSLTPAALTAAIVSPPPITLNAGAPATARATATVPAANGGFSKTPIGPFHTIVLAVASTAVKRSTVRGPMSRPICVSGISRMPTARPAALSTPSATITSTGSVSCTPRRRAASTAARAVSMRSGSTSDRPTAWPRARRNVKAMPPPITSASTLPIRCSTSATLSETLAPPSTATSGRAGASRIRPSAESSCCMSNPAAAGCRWCVMASIEACARWAAANASLT